MPTYDKRNNWENIAAGRYGKEQEICPKNLTIKGETATNIY